MKKALMFSLLLILFLSSVSLSQLAIKRPNWKNGERFSYEIWYTGVLMGSSDYSITRTIFEGRRAFLIQVSTVIKGTDQTTLDSVSLTVNRENLKPLNLERALGTTKAVTRVKARYLKDKVKIKLATPQGTKETDMDFPRDGYDNEEIILLLRALTLKEGAKFTFKDISPLSLASFPVEVEVAKPEKVKVPRGEYLCYKVRMKLPDKEIDLYFQKDKPNLLVKYVDNTGGTELLLREYQ